MVSAARASPRMMRSRLEMNAHRSRSTPASSSAQLLASCRMELAPQRKSRSAASCRRAVSRAFRLNSSRAFASGSRRRRPPCAGSGGRARGCNAVVGSWCILRQNVGQKPGLLGRDCGQKELRARAATMSSETPPSRSRGVRSSRYTGNGPAGKHLPHRQRNAGVDRYGPFPQHSSKAAGPRPEAVDQKAPEQAETRSGGDALPEHEGRSEQPRHRRPDAEDGPASRRDDDGGCAAAPARSLIAEAPASVSSCRLSSRVRQRSGPRAAGSCCRGG